MSSQAAMRIARIERNRSDWTVQITAPDGMREVSGGRWSRTADEPMGGLSVHAPDADALRGVAHALLEAADRIDSRRVEG